MASLATLPNVQAVGQDGSCTLPNNDTTPPFTDRCYHQGVWFSPDTAQWDILILPPTTPWALRELQLIEQSVDNWQAGVRALGAPWLQGLQINDYTVGRDFVPATALADPEVIIALHTNALPLGSYAGLATQVSFPICGNIPLDDPTASDSWHSHDGVTGNFVASCGQFGKICVVTNAATLAVPGDNDRRMDFDLISHEVGHCLTLGHVGDADTESTDDSTAYPEHDIMSYENDGIHATSMHCPSNLDVRTIEKAFGALLGQPGATTQVAPAAAGYVHMHPDDWRAPACVQPTATVTDTQFLLESDPAGLGQAPDGDGDGVPDDTDACPGHDDRVDSDGDGVPEGCDADDEDGPDGDLDGDGVRNADDRCAGLDDASPACQGGSLETRTLYFGRGELGSPSGNADAIWGDETSVLKPTLTLNEEAPTFTDPATVLAMGVDGTAPHNPLYDAAEWTTPGPVALNSADVEVVWWAMAPASGAAFYPSWDVKLYFDGAANATAEALDVLFDVAPASVPTEYRLTLPDVIGSGRLTVQVDPAPYLNYADFLVLYDAAGFPSRIVIGPDAIVDADGDGVNDDVDACPGHDDRLDQDSDGVPDACDSDRDGDGVANGDDWAPDDASEWADGDGDGTGDNGDICPGADDGADWDGDGLPDGCDDHPIAITSPSEGQVLQGDVLVTGTTPGTDEAGAGSQSVGIPDAARLPGAAAHGLLRKPWMDRLEARLSTLPGYHGLLAVAEPAGPVLHLFAEGAAGAAEVAVPAGWSLQRHDHAEVAPLSLTVTRGSVGPQLPRGGLVTQGLGPGTPLYVQFDGDESTVGICTANYLWKDQAGRLWLGAAGHCFVPADVENADQSYDFGRTQVFACRSDCVAGGFAGAQTFFEWQAGAPLDIVPLGTVGYARQQGVGQDFGVVAIPDELLQDLEPEMPGAGGPYGVYPDGFLGDTYLLHGNGVGVAETAATKTRAAIGDGDGGDKTSWAMVGLSNGGDSGSAVNAISWLSDQGVPIGTGNPFARGLLTHGYADPVTGLLPSIPIAFGTTVAQAQAMATEAGLCLDLVLADEDPRTRPAAAVTPACDEDEAGLPAQVVGLAATAGNGQVTLSWSVPDDGGSPLTGYTVRYGADGETGAELPVASPGAVVSGLSNGVAYTFTVAARNALGEGVASAPVVATPERPLRFTVDVRVDGGAWANVEGYDDVAESWQVTLPGLADGAHVVEARLLDLGVERARTSVGFRIATDSDGDGVADGEDACHGHDDAADRDGDGVPDGCDTDRDGDGWSNDDEAAAGSDPDDAQSVPSTCDAKPNPKKPKCK